VASILLLWWLCGLVGAISLLMVGSKDLAWRLFFSVPFAGTVAMILYPYADPERGLSFRTFFEPTFWISVAFTYAYGVVRFGFWAIFLGELGWIAVRAVSLQDKISNGALIPAGAIIGGLVGCLLQSATHALFSLRSEPVPFWVWAPTWLSMGAAGGVVGGILVAYHSVKESPREKPSLAHVQSV
jgi:hypothetical protein